MTPPIDNSLAAGAYAEAPDERARMDRISGMLWIVGAVIGAGAAFLPGAIHEGLPWVLGMSVLVFLYGVGSVTGAIAWQRATMNELAIGMVVTIPVVGLALYLTGASLSYIEPFLVCSLLYAAFFFPGRWAWPLVIELILSPARRCSTTQRRPRTPSCRATPPSPPASSPPPG